PRLFRTLPDGYPSQLGPLFDQQKSPAHDELRKTRPTGHRNEDRKMTATLRHQINPLARALAAAGALGLLLGVQACKPADAAITTAGHSIPVHTEFEEIIGEEVAILTSAPNVPAPITRKHATKVIVNLETTEE